MASDTAVYVIHASLLLVSVSLAASLLGRLISKLVVDWHRNPPEALALIEGRVLGALRVDTKPKTSWREYLASLLALNFASIALATLALYLQGVVRAGPPVSLDLAFNTAVSLVTNTGLQHYVGERDLSALLQVLVVIPMSFVASATGLSVAVAFMRSLVVGEPGNFFADFLRSLLVVYAPISVLAALALVAAGVPAGPVASLVAIKLLGNVGAGYFGANSAHPLENPSALTNFFEAFLMLLVPLSLPFAYERIAGRGRGYSLYAIDLVLLSLLLAIAPLSGFPLLGRGVEPRLGGSPTLIFNVVSALTNTGATSSSLTPMGPSAVSSILMGMFIQSAPGSALGFVYLTVYVVIVVFIGSLMVGKTPRFLGRAVSPRAIKYAVALFLVHPVIILVPTVVAQLTGACGFLGPPGPATFTKVLLEFSSAASNTGMSYLGDAANTPFWNVSTAIVMLLGRYVPIALMLLIAEDLAGTPPVSLPDPVETRGLLFVAFSTLMILVLFLLTFFPFIAIGPLASG
ncbi:potassium-transporting ATPase subunit KdpA [Thermofilum pendens]|uniref:Potassium-transporting ATPase n=1 Tax=Thermofilum pendens (strain DSM 2475 / Hrk 5) TaxID=368408 RepID=A1S096_THEPD|nr:potassium-transporting ATPase subunit KdpA [Thermofilum pendens]ABL78876.1 Potassium-transporting ATPase [Thermofilum pendens Hrk 5]